MILKINKKLWPQKCLYYFEFSIVGTLFIYLSPFLSEWGITTTEMAVINLITNLFAFILRPLCGIIADKYKIYKEVIMTLTATCGVTFMLLLLSPKHPIQKVHRLNREYSFNMSSDLKVITMYSPQRNLSSCWPSTLYTCNIKSLNSLKTDLVLKEMNYLYAQYVPVKNNVSFLGSTELFSCENISSNCNNSQSFEVSSNNVRMTWSSTFWIMGLAKMIGITCFSPLYSLTDAITFINLGYENCSKFGFTRMFGTIGMLISSLLMGSILQSISLFYFNNGPQWILNLQRFSKFSSCFIIAAIYFLVLIIVTLFINIDYLQKKTIVQKKNSLKSKFLEVTALNDLLRNWEERVCILFVVFGGFFYVAFNEYIFLILFQRYSSLPKYFPGLVIFITTISETIVFGTSSKLLRNRSYEFWVSLSFLTWGIRWFSYIFIDNFWFLLLLETLHGPSFGFMLVSMMTHIRKGGTQSNQGKIQGMFSAIFFNLGGALGGLMGGIILDNFGYFGFFKIMSVLGFCCSVYYPLQIYVVKRICKPPKDKYFIINIDNDPIHSLSLL